MLIADPLTIDMDDGRIFCGPNFPVICTRTLLARKAVTDCSKCTVPKDMRFAVTFSIFGLPVTLRAQQ